MMLDHIENWPNGTRKEWIGAAGTYTEYGPDGDVITTRPLTAEELGQLTYEPTPALDIVSIANNLAALTEAVDFLIINAL